MDIIHKTNISFLRKFLTKTKNDWIDYSFPIEIFYFSSGGGTHLYLIQNQNKKFLARINFYPGKNDWKVKKAEYEVLKEIEQLAISPKVFVLNENNPEPDFDAGIVTAIVLREHTEVGWVWPGYPWWGCWYCWYTPIPVAVDYEVGTVLVNMMDHRQGGTDFEPSWMGLIRGLPSSDESYNADRTVEGINQAFDQSPYLN